MSDETVSKAITELGITKVLPLAYEDLLQPAARELGKDLLLVAKSISIALAPLEGVVWGYEQIREWLAVKITERLARTSKDAIQPPPLNLAGPAVWNLRFTMDIPLLREMYARLLASSMDRNTAASAHPAFVRIIEQLSPDEARILAEIARQDPYDALCHDFGNERDIRPGKRHALADQWELICKNAGVESPKHNGAYMDNLLRLRLLAHLHENKAKLIPEGGNDNGTWDAHISESVEQSLYLTEFGESFIAACVD